MLQIVQNSKVKYRFPSPKLFNLTLPPQLGEEVETFYSICTTNKRKDSRQKRFLKVLCADYTGLLFLPQNPAWSTLKSKKADLIGEEVCSWFLEPCCFPVIFVDTCVFNDFAWEDSYCNVWGSLTSARALKVSTFWRRKKKKKKKRLTVRTDARECSQCCRD